MRLGLIGCGSIGGAVAAAIERGDLPGLELIGIADLTGMEVVKRVAANIRCPVWTDIASLLSLKPDLVLEAASADAVRSCAAKVFEGGSDLMIVSIGALADAEFLQTLIELATKTQRHLHVPSGAIGGLDIIKAAVIDGLEECRLTTTKPPAAFDGVAYVRERGMDLSKIQHPTVIFEGTAREAAVWFPQNLNVAVTISLAGLGADKTTVRIVADPASVHNVHEVFLRGKFGEATVRLVNQPSPHNPKSSYLTALSVIAALQRLGRRFQLGT